MISKQTYSIFKKGSVTYFNASLFFPSDIKNKVFQLYAFVRLADDFVDRQEQDAAGFEQFVSDYQACLAGECVDNQVINEFVTLLGEAKFEPSWVEAFFDSMRSDFSPQTYQTMDDTLKYIYGSAEVIGLMMARILKLDKKADDNASMLGRAMQYANFIRDIKEDNQLARLYFPQTELKQYGLNSLVETETRKKEANFTEFIQAQIKSYRKWQAEAESGYKYINKRNLIPVKTAADMYSWTLDQIAQDPFIVYDKVVKPTKRQVLGKILQNSITL